MVPKSHNVKSGNLVNGVWHPTPKGKQAWCLGTKLWCLGASVEPRCFPTYFEPKFEEDYKYNILGFKKQVPLGGDTLGQGSFGEKNTFWLGLKKEKKIEEKKGLPSPQSLFSSPLFVFLLISMVVFLLIMI